MPANVKHLTLKFHDTVRVPHVDDIGGAIEQQGIGRWSQLAQRHPAIRIRRLYGSLDEAQLRGLVDRARAISPDYRPPNFHNYFVVQLPLSGDHAAAADTLRGWAGVEFAHVAPEVRSAASVNPAFFALNPNQHYMDAAPVGIGARGAWNIPGGDGSGQAVIDLEIGWTLNHDDLAVHRPQLLFGAIEDSDRSHGTSVLGIICAANNPAGIAGIVPNVRAVNVVSAKADAASDPQASTIPEAIAQAALHLAFGDVLLLELELGFLPCETDPSIFSAISLATAAGIVVVEVAGNGNQHLDLFTNAAGHHVLARGNPEFTDSLAIMVASSTTGTPHTRRANSNFGTRIDCYAWGDSVQTCSSTGAADTKSHALPPDFTDTSAAAAIIAGAALSVQGMREAAGLPRLGPADLRAALQNGTASADPIGVMPDLSAIGASISVKPSAPSAPTGLHVGG